MAYVNWVTYEAQMKVVYYGPAFAGKTTSLRYLSSRLETDVKELPTTDDRSVFFEYAQSQKLPANNLEVKFLFWTSLDTTPMLPLTGSRCSVHSSGNATTLS